MLEVIRLVTSNAHSYDDVKLIDYQHEQVQKGVKKFITQPDLIQILIETKAGERIILSDWMVGIIEVRKMRAPPCAHMVKRIVLAGEISHAKVALIEEEDWKRLKIPKVFPYQLSFVSDKVLYLCHQDALLEIVL